eukprot:symbB.v1.2.004492.t1/scaffold250.1/size251770/3
MPGFEAIKPEQGPSAAEAQKSLDKAAVANRAAATAELANALGREGRHEESLTKGLEALDLCEEQKDKKGKGCCFYILGRTHFLKGALLSAQDMSAKALAIFQEVKDATWEEAAAKILLAAAVSSAGPGGAKAAVSIAPGDMQALSARCSAKRAAEAMQVAAECRRQSLLRMSEAKVLINRGDHEAALNCVADAFSLSEGEPDELSRRPSICPSGLGIGHSEATSLAAVETLGKNPKLQVTALTCKANVLAMRGDLTAARTAALEAVEAAKSSKDAAAHVAALYTLAVIQASPELEQKAEVQSLACFSHMTLSKFDFRPESSIWRFGDASSSALVKDFETRGRKCLLWHRVKFHGSCQKCHVATPSRECSACFMQFQGIWRTSARIHSLGAAWTFEPEVTCRCKDVEMTWSPCGILHRFGGWNLGVIGDSMARQLFQRFVSFFRTPTGPVLDAYFGSGAGGTKRTARYEVNEKEDCLYLDTGPPCPKLSEPKFSVTFVPEKDASARDVKHLEIFRRQYKLDAMVVLNGYWYRPDLLNVNMTRLARYGKDFFSELNLASKQQAASTKNLHFVDFDRLAQMAHNGTWVNAEDRMHYMCSGYPSFEEHRPWTQIKAFRGSVNGYNCDDPVNGALVEAILAADEALQVAKSIGKSAEISALCLQATVQGDGAPAQAAFNLAGGDDLLEVESLCSLAQAQLNYSHLPSEALATSQKVLKLFTARKDTVGQAAAGSMVATCSSMMGQASVASAAASDACNVAEDMGSEVGALQTSMLSALSSNRPSEALDAGRRLLKIARHFEDPVAEAWALLELSRLQLAEDPGQGVRSAEEALAVATKASSTSPILGRRALANATVVLARAHVLREKAVAARRVVEKLQELPGRGSDALCHGRRGEALAQLLAAKVLQGSGPAVAAARNAQVLMKGVRDQAGEAAATLAVAEALSAQQNLDQAMEAASTAAMGFKAAKCGLGEGVALCTLATIQLRREDALEAEKTSKEALRIFQQVRSFSGLKRCLAVCGEARARQLLAHTQLTSLQPSSARVFFDEFNCAHLELTEMASQESLEAVVATLHGMQRQRNKVKAVVMHLDGVVGPANMHSYALSSGNFLVGLRSISVPVVLAASGKISGPSWQLVLGCDYRICSMDTDFLLPILSPPECLGELVGPAIASQLCISSGILDAQALQELGILNQVRPSKDETGRAASEMAKRIAAFPGIACRQTMSLLTVPPVRYTTVGSYKLPDPDLIA